MSEESDRLRALAADWDRYGQIPDPKWRDMMRRATVIELMVALNELAEACGDPPLVMEPRITHREAIGIITKRFVARLR